MEICGTYARSPHPEGGFHKRPACDFAHNHGCGARRARQALGRVMAGSRSPMETVVTLLLTLPQELSGCGLPQLRLNLRVEIPPDLQVALGKPYLVVCPCWPSLLLIVEYDSCDHHSGAHEVDGDDARNEGLRNVGWMVRSVTSGILLDDALLATLRTRSCDTQRSSLSATSRSPASSMRSCASSSSSTERGSFAGSPARVPRALRPAAPRPRDAPS